MKKVRIILFLTLLTLSFSVTAQERGFFHIYPLEGDAHFPLSMSMAEAQDGSFILAIDNSIGGPGATFKRLLKLSNEGELLHSVPFGEESGLYVIFNVFRHPNDPNMYVGTGFLCTLLTTDPYIQFTSVPYFVHFDDNLNITAQYLGEWPELYQNPIEVSGRYGLFRDGKVFGVFGFELPSDSIPHYGYRLFAEMSLEGEFETFALDTAAFFPGFNGVEAVFEFPVTRQKGMLRRYNKHVQGNQYESTHGLYRLNKVLEASLLNDYHFVYNDSTVVYNPYYLSYYYMFVADQVATTVLPLDDSTLLLPMIGDEIEQRIYFSTDSTVFLNDNAPVLLKTDTDGNLQQIQILGRRNDTLEAIRNPVALTEADETGHKCFYCCHYSRHQMYLENPNALTVTKLTDEFEILWRKTYALPDTYLEPHEILATSDGGCLIIGNASRGNLPYYGTYEWFALKLEADGSEGSGEITVKDEIFIYPNPVRDILHLSVPTYLKPIRVELFDLQGRLVRTQSNAFESIDMGQLPTGTYTLRVTLEDGKTYSDKVVKE